MGRLRPMWLLGCGSAVTMTAAFLAPSMGSVPYPDGYRHWVHVKSALIGPGRPSHGLHHIYANDKALIGYQTGRFPDGSVIVFDLLDVTTTDAVTAEASRIHVDVMRKDDSQFPEDGGWGFEEFQGDSREPSLDAPTRTGCRQCHSKQKDNDFVFSQFRK